MVECRKKSSYSCVYDKLINIGFEALHGEVHVHVHINIIRFAVTPCVYLLAR